MADFVSRKGRYRKNQFQPDGSSRALLDHGNGMDVQRQIGNRDTDDVRGSNVAGLETGEVSRRWLGGISFLIAKYAALDVIAGAVTTRSRRPGATSEVWIVTSFPSAPMATPRSPSVRAGASFSPSPTTMTLRPSAQSWRMVFSLSSGRQFAWERVMPVWAEM